MTDSDTPEHRLPSDEMAQEPDTAAEHSSENAVLVEDAQPTPESGDGTSPEETPPASETLSFVDMLVMAGMLAKEQAYVAQETARREKLPLWRVLVRDGLVVSQDLAALTALHRGLTMVDLRNQTIDHEAVAILPEQVSRKYSVLPIRVKDGTLTVAMPDPTDLQVIQDLSAFTGLAIDPVVATAEDVLEHIDVSYRLIENTSEEGTSETASASSSARVTAQRLRDAPPAQIIDLLLQQGVQDRASDIHIAPTETRLRVRFRIDGVLQDVMSLPMELAPTIISRLKIMGGMNIAERRRPQDGQFSAELQNRQVDVRVAMSNTVNGETAVLRILDKGFALFGLNQLGMSPQALEQYRRLLRLPYGMIIICGPTGSGKSTTLYASILQMNRVEHNVISLEDPVEYRIGDVNQIQVHTEAGITFATQLRSVLRLDPDVILIGEIRDQETAIIATQAALTGHLVLTSLHANDSAGALVRLRDLGVASYLIASSVAGIVSQRMVRNVCTSCQAMTPRPDAEQKAFAAVTGEAQEQFIYGAGCNMCAQTGYRGRSGAYEVLTMTDSIRRLFLADAGRDEIWQLALEEGLIPLRQDGMQKVKAGVTTPYEVMRVLFSLE